MAAGAAAGWLARALRQVLGSALGRAPSSPAAGRRSRALSLPEAWACRQCLVAAEAHRLARSSAAAWAQRWAAPVVLAAAAVAQRSAEPAALDAAAVAEGAAAVQRDAVAAPQPEEVRDAGAAAVEEAVAQLGAAGVPRPAEAPGGRAQPRAARPSVAGLSFRLPAARLAPSTRARSAHARESL
jgi:hypothetical protein